MSSAVPAKPFTNCAEWSLAKLNLLVQVHTAGQQHVNVRRQQPRIDGTENLDHARVVADHVDAVRVGGQHAHALGA